MLITSFQPSYMLDRNLSMNYEHGRLLIFHCAKPFWFKHFLFITRYDKGSAERTALFSPQFQDYISRTYTQGDYSQQASLQSFDIILLSCSQTRTHADWSGEKSLPSKLLVDFIGQHNNYLWAYCICIQIMPSSAKVIITCGHTAHLYTDNAFISQGNNYLWAHCTLV